MSTYGTDIINNSLIVRGSLNVGGGIVAPTGSIPGTYLSSSTPAIVAALGQQRSVIFSQPNTNAATPTTQVISVVQQPAALLYLYVGSVTAATGTSTATVNLLINGTSCLTGTVTLNSTNTAYGTVSAGFSTNTLAAGQVVAIQVTTTSGTGSTPLGLFAQLVVNEAPIV